MTQKIFSKLGLVFIQKWGAFAAFCVILLGVLVLAPSRSAVAMQDDCDEAYQRRLAHAETLRTSDDGGLLYEATKLDAKVRLDLCRKGIQSASPNMISSSSVPVSDKSSPSPSQPQPNTFPAACLGALLNTYNCTVVYCNFIEQSGVWTAAGTAECIRKISAQKHGVGADKYGSSPAGSRRPPDSNCDGPVRYGACAEDKSGAVHQDYRTVGPDGRISPYDQAEASNPYAQSASHDSPYAADETDIDCNGHIRTSACSRTVGPDGRISPYDTSTGTSDDASNAQGMAQALQGDPAHEAIRPPSENNASRIGAEKNGHIERGQELSASNWHEAPDIEITDELATALTACNADYRDHLIDQIAAIDRQIENLAQQRQSLNAEGDEVGKEAIESGTKFVLGAGSVAHKSLTNQIWNSAVDILDAAKEFFEYRSNLDDVHENFFSKVSVDEQIAQLKAERATHVQDLKWVSNEANC